jgi:hypothetical protein
MKIRFRREGQLIGEYEENDISSLLNLKVLLLTDEFWNAASSQWQIVSSATVAESEVPSALGDQPPNVKSIRIMGCCLLAFGGILFWLCVWDPLQEASMQAKSVSFSFKGVFLIPAFLIVGALGAIVPSSLPGIFKSPDGGNGRKWGAAVIFLIAGAILYAVVSAKVHSLGYR